MGKQESSWRLGPAEAVMGAPKLCNICMGESGGGGSKGKGGAVLNPRTLACSGCPRRSAFSKGVLMVTLCSKYSRELTFQNLLQGTLLHLPLQKRGQAASPPVAI